MTGEGTAELVGVVLAGGWSRRMGRDKGSIVLDGQALVERAVAQLEPFCAQVCVSARSEQAAVEPYRRFELVIDEKGVAGPAAGLLAAWRRFPGRALLVLAADLARVDAGLLRRLVAGRRAGDRIATAYRHPDGTPEPLCAIWEPGVAAAVRSSGVPEAPSLRKLLETAKAELLEAERPEQLVSVNTEEDFAAVQSELDGRR